MDQFKMMIVKTLEDNPEWMMKDLIDYYHLDKDDKEMMDKTYWGVYYYNWNNGRTGHYSKRMNSESFLKMTYS